MVTVSRGMVWFSFSFVVCTGGMVVDGFRQDGWDVGLMWVISFCWLWLGLLVFTWNISR